MSKNSYHWFIMEWLQHLEKKTASSRWNKAKTLMRKNKVTSLEIHQGKMNAQVSDDITKTTILIEVMTLSGEASERVVSFFIQHPSMILKVYQGLISQELAWQSPHSLGFVLPEVISRCSCGEPAQPCLHVLATLLAAAEKCQEDPTLFLMINGIAWERVLENLGGQEEADLRPSIMEQYRLVPMPESKTAAQEKKKQILVAPPFWTSPFPYVLIMQEIYDKVVLEARKSISSSKSLEE